MSEPQPHTGLMGHPGVSASPTLWAQPCASQPRHLITGGQWVLRKFSEETSGPPAHGAEQVGAAGPLLLCISNCVKETNDHSA